ncbi:MAG: 50S ribosomal protein L4 [Lentimicrobiaceae bacterium]|jgi:large subunit ribosomal protein L4|nr:50S ribosomal protein L4 [Lentimicrobiaceae bacterium]MCP4909434.1 50S ribosomal protein L4 [Bacteroidota bacterium]MBT3454146.1 50S ribosomal protein L4 [Lentimicrobiaceae bacterium]MBT3819320.1 50S ribosomal protein L4 [Lentimicrobiaceae bacterium]MBT4060993.1 50S ribosomal protein L4 [Lentimicrobiaceae bacterium]
MELVVHKVNGEATSRKVKLDDSIFGIEPNDHAIYLDAKQYMAGQRQGTHDSKERSDIIGSTRKIKRQKGTGTARAGSIKNPLFRGGGRIFGPHPRNYSFKLNKKVKRLARKSALSYKAQEKNILVVEDFKLENPKTKDFKEILKNFNIDSNKTLVVLNNSDENIYLSARNLQKVKVLRAEGINTYEILNAKKIVFVESSLKTIVEVFAKN